MQCINVTLLQRQTRGTRAAAAAATVALMEEAEGDTEAQTQEVQETVIKEEAGSEVKVEQDAEMTEVNVASVAMSEEAQPQESGDDEKQETKNWNLLMRAVCASAKINADRQS